MSLYGFPKREHLVLKRDIDALFTAGGHSLAAYPVRAIWRLAPSAGDGARVKVMVSVSKRKFKHAVSRNRAKRQLREAYRLNKSILSAEGLLPADRELCADIMCQHDTRKKCELCGKPFHARSNRAKYCDACAVLAARRMACERKRRERERNAKTKLQVTV